MQVARHLARLIACLRLVHQPQGAKVQGLDDRAGQAIEIRAQGLTVVIALQPQPVAAEGQPLQRLAVAVGHTRDGAAVMEAVAEQDDAAGVHLGDLGLQPGEGGG